MRQRGADSRIVDKSARLTWPDDTHVDLYFVAKDDAKSQIAVQHRKLADKEDACLELDQQAGGAPLAHLLIV